MKLRRRARLARVRALAERLRWDALTHDDLEAVLRAPRGEARHAARMALRLRGRP